MEADSELWRTEGHRYAKKSPKSTVLVLFLSFAFCWSYKEIPCEEKNGFVLYGYCDQDVITSGNPNAGKCIYCPVGTTLLHRQCV